MTHYDIPTKIPCYVESYYLYGCDANYEGKWTKGEIVGVSSYKGESLTFIFRTDEGSMFYYIPTHWIATDIDKRNNVMETTWLGNAFAVYHNCPSNKLTISVNEFMKQKLSCFFVDVHKWMQGEYLFTVDWVDDNILQHVILLETGQLAVLPPHKVKVDGPRSFQPFKKLRGEWKSRH